MYRKIKGERERRGGNSKSGGVVDFISQRQDDSSTTSNVTFLPPLHKKVQVSLLIRAGCFATWAIWGKAREKGKGS